MRATRWPLLVTLALPLGCGPQEQAPSCGAFVACVQALDRVRGTATNVARFAPEGGCWGGKAGAKLCGDACERGLQVLRGGEGAGLAECAP